VLHPYFKLHYIKLAWGGAEEQAAERAAGDRSAKNWQEEALKIVENTVSISVVSSLPDAVYNLMLDGRILEDPPSTD
jgi:hypothetical protein